MYEKEIKYFGRITKIHCDGKCNKAWGKSQRYTYDENDKMTMLSDDELGEAPEDPGTYEGECGKPKEGEEKFNKWCVRECERCEIDPFEKSWPAELMPGFL